MCFLWQKKRRFDPISTSRHNDIPMSNVKLLRNGVVLRSVKAIDIKNHPVGAFEIGKIE